MGMAIESTSRVVRFQPVLDTSVYAANDRMGSLVEIPNFVDESSGATTVTSVTVADASTNGAQFRILFFRDQPTIASADNAALDIADAIQQNTFVGHIPVVTADYINLSSGRLATVRNVGLVIPSASPSQTNPTGRSVWVLLQSNGTPTYAANDLVITLGLSN